MWYKIDAHNPSSYPQKTDYYLVEEIAMPNLLSQIITPAIVKWDKKLQHWETKNKVVMWMEIPTLPQLSEEDKKQNLLMSFDAFATSHSEDAELFNTWRNLDKTLSYNQLYIIIAKVYQKYWQKFK